MSSVHVKFGDHAFNLLADDSGEPVNLESVIHTAIRPDICAAFSMDSFQSSDLLFVPLKVSMDVSAAHLMVCCIIMDDTK